VGRDQVPALVGDPSPSCVESILSLPTYPRNAMAQVLTLTILIGLALATINYVAAYVQGRATYRQYVADKRARASDSNDEAAPCSTDDASPGSEGVRSDRSKPPTV
jgi:hypothetical protein